MDELRFTAILPPSFLPSAEGAREATAGAGDGTGDFLTSLKDAIAQTNTLQGEANSAVERMVTGGDQSLHQTLVALQEADVSFQLMMKIRNKIVTAYEEINRMQI